MIDIFHTLVVQNNLGYYKDSYLIYCAFSIVILNTYLRNNKSHRDLNPRHMNPRLLEGFVQVQNVYYIFKSKARFLPAS